MTGQSPPRTRRRRETRAAQALGSSLSAAVRTAAPPLDPPRQGQRTSRFTAKVAITLRPSAHPAGTPSWPVGTATSQRPGCAPLAYATDALGAPPYWLDPTSRVVCDCPAV